jgi:hypothetical protein
VVCSMEAETDHSFASLQVNHTTCSFVPVFAMLVLFGYSRQVVRSTIRYAILPRLLLISPALLHAHQIRLGFVSLHLAMALEYFNQRFANSLWHFAGRAADVYNAVLVCERVVHLFTLLPHKILDINFLALHIMSVNVHKERKQVQHT